MLDTKAPGIIREALYRKGLLLKRHFRKAPQLEDTQTHQIKALLQFLKLFAKIPFANTRGIQQYSASELDNSCKRSNAAFGALPAHREPLKIKALHDSQSAKPRLIKVDQGYPSSFKL